MITKSQQIMVDEGFPKEWLFTTEQRAEIWKKNRLKFAQQQMQLNEAGRAIKAKLESEKAMETDPMISITTNTRGNTQMAKNKDYAEMNSAELVAAYNKISGKEPIKKFKDKATALARLAAAESEKKAKVAKPKVAKANGAAVEKAVSDCKRAAEFGARVGSYREKLIIALDSNYRHMVAIPDLLKGVYGSKNLENTGALGMVINGAKVMIEKGKLPYELRKDKNAETKEISYGLYPK